MITRSRAALGLLLICFCGALSCRPAAYGHDPRPHCEYISGRIDGDVFLVTARCSKAAEICAGGCWSEVSMDVHIYRRYNGQEHESMIGSTGAVFPTGPSGAACTDTNGAVSCSYPIEEIAKRSFSSRFQQESAHPYGLLFHVRDRGDKNRLFTYGPEVTNPQLRKNFEVGLGEDPPRHGGNSTAKMIVEIPAEVGVVLADRLRKVTLAQWDQWETEQSARRQGGVQ